MIAVITGDLVHSSKMSSGELKLANAILSSLIESIQIKQKALGELYRGDGFQIALEEPSNAAQYTLLIICALKSDARLQKPMATTISIGLGKAKHLADRAGLSQGEAFELSGRGLDKSERGTLSFHCADARIQQILDLPTKFLSFLLKGLTPSQARVLYHYIEEDFPEHEAIAEVLQTSRQNITKHLQRSGAHLIKDYLALFQSLTAGAE